jgi:hypothetical protein
MPVINTLYPSYVDVAQRMDPDGSIAAVIELLNLINPIMEDTVTIEGNLPTGHRTTVRSGLPSATWRLLNYGVQPSKSRTVQVTDNCGMLEAYAEIDKALADLNGNAAAFRMSEDKAFLEAMMQEFCSTLFYGNAGTTPERFTGLAPRYASLTGAPSGANIQDALGVQSDNTSVYFVQWGPDTCHLTYPKGSVAGWQKRDLGEETLFDGQTPAGRYQGYRTHYKWDVGLVLRDWRFCGRLANIDVSNLVGGTYTTLIDDMVKLYYRLFAVTDRLRIYCNRTVATYLHLLAMKGTTMQLRIEQYAGQPITTFLGAPIRVCDAISNAEARVT